MQGLAHYDDSPSPPAGPSRRSDRPGPSGTVPQKRKKEDERLPENLTHTSQSALRDSELSADPVTVQEEVFEDVFAGLSEEEILRQLTRPPDIEGMVDWGIPPPVNPEECSPQLKAKVAQYLRLKYDHNQHINTSLLSSASFSNPHIYAKLVEFVELDERATSFPGGGWATRRGLEEERKKYGPKVMSEDQKRRQEAVKRSQEVGKRSTIDFKPSRDAVGRDQDRDRTRTREKRRDGERRNDKGYPEMDRREKSRLLGSSGIGGQRRDRDGGWDVRDMRKDKESRKR